MLVSFCLVVQLALMGSAVTWHGSLLIAFMLKTRIKHNTVSEKCGANACEFQGSHKLQLI